MDLSEAGKSKLGMVLTAEMADSFNEEFHQTIAKANDILLIPLPTMDVTISASGKSSGTITLTKEEGSLTCNYSKMTKTYVEVSFQYGEGKDVIAKLHTPKSIGLKLGGFIEVPEAVE